MNYVIQQQRGGLVSSDMNLRHGQLRASIVIEVRLKTVSISLSTKQEKLTFLRCTWTLAHPKCLELFLELDIPLLHVVNKITGQTLDYLLNLLHWSIATPAEAPAIMCLCPCHQSIQFLNYWVCCSPPSFHPNVECNIVLKACNLVLIVFSELRIAIYPA